MSLSVVDVEGDEVLALDAGAVLVVDPDVLSLKAQLEELTLGDGNLHLSVLTGHLRLDNVIVTCQKHGRTSSTVHADHHYYLLKVFFPFTRMYILVYFWHQNVQIY